MSTPATQPGQAPQPPAASATNAARPSRSSMTLRIAAPLLTGVVLALTPAPSGLAPNAWHYFALFAAVVVALVTEPVPVALVGFLGIVLGAISGFVYKSPAQATNWALSGFANSTVWLVFSAYMFALGYSKTGLGKRIALLLIRRMGRSTLGLGYAVALSDLLLAPVMPSNTARSGGTIYPIVQNIPELYGSRPDDGTARKIGSYLLYTALAVSCVTSSMFLTALAPNILALAIASKTIGVSISWLDWFKGFLPAGLVLFPLLPWLLYKIYPPEIKASPEAPRWAAEELRRMGPVSKKEIHLLVLVLGALLIWIGGAKFVDPAIAAMLAVAMMVLVGVVTWTDVIGYRQAWDVLIYFGTLVAMASGLAEVKFVDWIARDVASAMQGLGTVAAILLLVAAFYFLHYLFASITAHATAMLPVFFAVAVHIPGVSRVTMVLLLSYALGLFGILTPYATGPAPIYFSGGYISRRDFWLYGLILGLIFFCTYLLLVIPWLRFLGM
jgi:L-tartrate/succinate antiporter